MSTNQWLAMVALHEAEMPPLEQVGQVMLRDWPGASPISDITQRGNVVTFRLGGAAAALTLFPRPIPWQQLEGPCACAWYWPEAAEEMRRHQAHLLVALLDERPDQAEKAVLLTRLLSAILQSSDAAGVFWGPGRLVHPPGAFVELSRKMTREELPLYLWIDFRIEPIDPGVYRLFTTGLQSLGYKELEVHEYEGHPQELLEAAYNVAHFLLDKRKEPNEGDTMGLADGRRLTVHHERSMIDPEQPVLQLEF